MIAQLVEHDLAKVGVASSSLVHRSFFYAQVAELVDAYVSGAYAARCAGSSPVLGTVIFYNNPHFGAPANFNLWGEREHGENSYERRCRESY